jgi:hypothetical protein
MNSPLRRVELGSPETIRRAAVMTNDVCFSLSPPANHARIIEWIKELRNHVEAPVLGFITSKNRFVTPSEAREIARDAGQPDDMLQGLELLLE